MNARPPYRYAVLATVLALVLANGSLAMRFKPGPALPALAAAHAAPKGLSALMTPPRADAEAAAKGTPSAQAPAEPAPALAVPTAEQAFARREPTVSTGRLAREAVERGSDGLLRLGAAAASSLRKAAPRLRAAASWSKDKLAAALRSRREARVEPRAEPARPAAARTPKPAGAKLMVWSRSGYAGARQAAGARGAGQARAAARAGHIWRSETHWSYRSDGSNPELDGKVFAALERQEGRMERGMARMDASLERSERSMDELLGEPRQNEPEVAPKLTLAPSF